MLEILVLVLCIWLFFKVLGLLLKMTWGITKFLASILFTVAIPMLIGCLIFTGGILILVPLALMGLALGLVKICV